MRILVGTTEIAGTINDFASGFRALGHEVTTCILNRNPLYPHASYDIDIAPAVWFEKMPSAIAKSRLSAVRIPRGATVRCLQYLRLLRLALKHDLFVFLWAGTSLTPNSREFPFLKAIGKKIVSVFLGSDVRDVESFAEEYRRSDQSVSPEFIATLAERSGDSTQELVRRVRHAELYSDLIYSQPNQSNLAIRPYMHLYLPADFSKLTFNVPNRAIPLVVHAPSSSAVKGTPEILRALNELKGEQVQFDFKLLSNLPNDVVLATLSDADVVVDQLYSGGYGKLSIESMASGCAVATRRFDVFWPDNPDVPIHHIDRDNLKTQLKDLLTNQSLRQKLAVDSRRYLERFHDAKNIAASMLSNLSSVSSPDFRYDYYPRFFFDRFNGYEFEGARSANTQIVRRWGLPSDLANDPAFAGQFLDTSRSKVPLQPWATAS